MNQQQTATIEALEDARNAKGAYYYDTTTKSIIVLFHGKILDNVFVVKTNGCYKRLHYLTKGD